MDRFYRWLRTLPGVTDPEDLRLDTLKEIAPVIYILSGIALFRSFRLSGHQLVASLIVGGTLIIGIVGAQRMRDHNFRIAWSWLVFWILAAISLETWGFPESPARYYFPAAIFMASLLTYVGNVLLVSFLSVIAVGTIALAQGRTWLDVDYVVYPTVLIALLATGTFITSRHLHEEVQRSRYSSGRVRDMLEQLRLQRVELDRTIKTLELANQRIENMNAELVVARNAAENADRIKTEFLAHMSHELRTPMNAILNFTAFVADGLMGDVNEEQVDTLQKVMDSGNHLLSLINDILDISKIEAGMMDLFIEEVDLNTILKGTLSTTKGLVKNKPIELISEISDDLPLISGDKRRIRQIFLNLVSNAVKFTPEGTITLKAGQKNGEIRVSVKDSGIGIAPEDQPIVFEAFKQAKHDLQTTPGTGLGLPICKHFIEAHGGNIWLESEAGKGTTFFVTLPISKNGSKPAEMDQVEVQLPEPDTSAAESLEIQEEILLPESPEQVELIPVAPIEEIQAPEAVQDEPPVESVESESPVIEEEILDEPEALEELETQAYENLEDQLGFLQSFEEGHPSVAVANDQETDLHSENLEKKLSRIVL